MARLPRLDLLGQPQHVIQRGNNREPVFCRDEDYSFYLEKLKDAAVRHECRIHAYVLMTNHVHLLITPLATGSTGRMMQSLGRYYVQYFNFSYQRTGTLWEGRYKATLIDSEAYLLTCMRYIELNPVRAGMVNHPVDYPWSSYGGNASGQADALLTAHREYQRLGKTVEERQAAYRQLFRGRLPLEAIEAIREATNKAWVLGNDRFRSKVEQQLERRTGPIARGGDHRSAAFRDQSKSNRV